MREQNYSPIIIKLNNPKARMLSYRLTASQLHELLALRFLPSPPSLLLSAQVYRLSDTQTHMYIIKGHTMHNLHN